MTYCYRSAYWMFHDAIQKIVDAPFPLTLITLEQRLYTQSWYAMNPTFSFDIHYCVYIYYHLHPGVLLPPNC
jgi:hypothetical protein